MSLLSDLVLSSIWLVHAEQGESHEVLAKHYSIFLFCDLVEDFLFDGAFFLNVHCLVVIIGCMISLLLVYCDLMVHVFFIILLRFKIFIIW